jgi:hypothetical protein
MTIGIAKFTVFVEAMGEEVMEHAGTHLPKLRNHRFGVLDCVIY